MSAATGPFVAACLLAVVYLEGSRLLPWEQQFPRRWLSVAAGASMAYVFLDVLPTLGEHHRALLEQNPEGSQAEHRIYGVALAGFVFSYALDEIVKRSRAREDRDSQHPARRFSGWVHIAGLALYGWIIGDALLGHGALGVLSLSLYVTAMGFHLLVVTSALAREGASFYRARGRWVLAASVLSGWSVAVLIPLPHTVMAYLYAFVAGGVLMTSASEELPQEKDGRFGWFAMGAGAYGTLIILT